MIPVYELFEQIDDLSIDAIHRVYQVVLNKLKEDGKFTKKPITLFNLTDEDLQSPLINEALFVEDNDERKKLFNKLSPQQKDLYLKMHELLQNEIAAEIREYRWWQWNEVQTAYEQEKNKKKKAVLLKRLDRTVPPDIRKNESERKRIIDEGRQALRDGNFKEWIANETFGTREYYFPVNFENADRFIQGVAVEDVDFSEGGKTAIGLGELHAAKERTSENLEPSQKPVLSAVMTHYRRAAVMNALKENFAKLNGYLKKSEITTEDAVRLQRWFDNILGRYQEVSGLVKFIERTNNLFWTTFALQLKKILHYTVRNFLQITFAASQMPKGVLMRSAVRVLSGKGNKYIPQEISQRWHFISQKMAIQNEYMLLKDAITYGAEGKTKSMVSYFLDMFRSLLPISDELYRKMTFPVFHEAAYIYGQQYLNKKISFNKLRSSLYLDNLNHTQIDKLERLLSKGNLKDFAYYISRYKSENIYFKYGRSARMMLEQNRNLRWTAGLFTYPRGVIELVIENSAKPFLRGMKDADIRTTFQATMTFAGLYIGYRIAGELSKALMGKRDYEDYKLIDTIFGYQPGGVGAKKILEVWDSVTTKIPAIIKNNEPKVAADKIAQLMSKDLIEWWFPFTDVMVSYYEVKNDTAGANLWRAIRGFLDEDYRETYGKHFYYDRNTLQSMQHILFGSEEFEQYQSDWGDKSSFEKFKRIAVGS